MKRTKQQIKKHIRLVSETSYNNILSEQRKRDKAAIEADKRSSLEYQILFASKKCVQNIHPFENEWKKLCRAKIKDTFKIEQARESILLAMDKAAADSIGRIIAEIKQTSLASKSIKNFVEVDLTVADFFAGFEKFCKKEFENYTISKEEFNNIISKYLNLNLVSLKSYGEKFGYTKPAEKFEENLKLIKNYAVKEQELSL